MTKQYVFIANNDIQRISFEDYLEQYGFNNEEYSYVTSIKNIVCMLIDSYGYSEDEAKKIYNSFLEEEMIRGSAI